MELTVRTALKLDKIAEIINTSGYREWLTDGKDGVNAEELQNANMTYYIFLKDNEMAGFCAFNKQDEDISVGDVAILDKFRGREGKYLSMLAIKKYFLENKCKMLITRIDKLNKRSRFFSKWLGFEKYFEDKKYIYMRLILWAAQ